PGAQVLGGFTGADSTSVVGNTSARGRTTFVTAWSYQPRGAVYLFRVTGVAKNNCVYAPDENVRMAVTGVVRREAACGVRGAPGTDPRGTAASRFCTGGFPRRPNTQHRSHLPHVLQHLFQLLVGELVGVAVAGERVLLAEDCLQGGGAA